MTRVNEVKYHKDDLIKLLVEYREKYNKIPGANDCRGVGNSALPSMAAFKRSFPGMTFDEICSEVFGVKTIRDTVAEYLHKRGGKMMYVKAFYITRELDTHYLTTTLGTWMAKHVGDVIGGYRIEKYATGTRKGKLFVATWVGEGDPPEINYDRSCRQTVTKDGLRKVFEEFRERHGRYPSSTDIRDRTDGIPCISSVIHLYGRYIGYDELMSDLVGCPTICDVIGEYLDANCSHSSIRFKARDVTGAEGMYTSYSISRRLNEHCASGEPINGFTLKLLGGNRMYTHVYEATRISELNRLHEMCPPVWSNKKGGIIA